MKMYEDYIKEREDLNLVTSDKGFATYLLKDNYCYIKDIYIAKDHRKSKEASRLADIITNIARGYNKKMLFGSVDNQANNSEISKKVLQGYNMKYATTINGLDYYSKEI